ncbi:hypothetical protein Syun_024008 [Stephania yunnanensis]|uniref:Uncharacterized protein n=1 Tax=Stephania yunnanensis TaxID=152371 RepID=A0AAP0I2M8_9MAGN
MAKQQTYCPHGITQQTLQGHGKLSLTLVMEDPNFVVLLQKKFSNLGSIPGVLLPHPSSSPFPCKVDEYGEACNGYNGVNWPICASSSSMYTAPNDPSASPQYSDQFNQIVNITPSMDSLEALLAKLPSVVPSSSPSSSSSSHQFLSSQSPLEFMKKEIMDNEIGYIGESSSSSSTTTTSMYSFHQYY